MMCLKNLGIKTLLHELGCYFDQLERDIYAHTHIGSKNNANLFCCAGYGCALFVIKASGANHTLGAVFFTGCQVMHGPLWQGKVDEAVCLFELRDIVTKLYPGLLAEQGASMGAQSRAATTYQGGTNLHIITVYNSLDENFTHAPIGATDCYFHCVIHDG